MALEMCRGRLDRLSFLDLRLPFVYLHSHLVAD